MICVIPIHIFILMPQKYFSESEEDAELKPEVAANGFQFNVNNEGTSSSFNF